MILAVSYLAASACEPNDSAVVYFRMGYRQFDPTLGNNLGNMEKFLDRVRKAKDINNIDKIVVRAYASPDGGNDANTRLTGYRCEEITGYILNQTGIDPSLLQSYPEGIAWGELRRMVAEDPEVPSQKKVLEILDNTPVWIYDANGKIIDGRKRQLQMLDRGIPYRWMFAKFFPALRNAVATSLFLKSDARAAVLDSTADNISGRLDASEMRLAKAEERLNHAEARLKEIESMATASMARKAAGEGLVSTARGHESVKDGQAAAGKGRVAVAEGVTATKEGREAAAEGLSAVAKAREAIANDKLAEAGKLAQLAEDYAAAAEKSLKEAEDKLVEAENLDIADGGSPDAGGQALSAQIVNDDHIPVHRFALKTNLLYYAALMPNLEFQWRINSLWSLSLEANIAWWKNASRHKYYQLFMISPEVRRFVIPKGEWHGMYVGAFAGAGHYDLENGHTGYKGEGAMAGLSAGYIWPVSRNLSLEAEIGAGYLYSKYKEYKPFDGHYIYLRSKNLSYFGPLKLKFSLVWRFDDIVKSKKVNPTL